MSVRFGDNSFASIEVVMVKRHEQVQPVLHIHVNPLSDFECFDQFLQDWERAFAVYAVFRSIPMPTLSIVMDLTNLASPSSIMPVWKQITFLNAQKPKIQAIVQCSVIVLPESTIIKQLVGLLFRAVPPVHPTFFSFDRGVSIVQF